jgi:Tfp pilus assembly protein PilO
MSDPAEVISILVGVAIIVGGGAWWLCSRIYKGQVAAKDAEINVKTAQIQLALAQRDELDAKLTDARANNSALQRQINTQASNTELLATANSTGNFFDELKIVSDRIGVTLGG